MPPTRKFHLLRLSTSTEFPKLRAKTPNCVDVDSSKSQKIAPFVEPDKEAVSDEADAFLPATVEDVVI